MGIAFGISRPPLREALKALTLMGVLESRQGGRYTVTDLSPSRLVAPFNVMLSVGDYDVDEHFEARLVVDLDARPHVRLRATPERAPAHPRSTPSMVAPSSMIRSPSACSTSNSTRR